MENRQVKMSKEEKEAIIANYMAQLGEQQLKALELAKNHLGTSFNISKSNGFKEWFSKMCCSV